MSDLGSAPPLKDAEDARVVGLREAASDALSWIENYPLNHVQTDGWDGVADELRDALADRAQPQDWLVPCQHCERGNVVSLHPDGSVWANGKKLP